MFKKIVAILLCLAFASPVLGGTANRMRYGAMFPEMAAPDTPPSGYGVIYFDTSGVLKSLNDDGTSVSLSSGSGDNTLDNAYDQGGAGAGKAITADSGAVAISNTDADTAFLFTLNASPSGAAALGGAQITVGANSTQDALEFANSGSGYDIYGTGGAFTLDKSGNIVCNNITPSGNFYSTAFAAAASGNANLTIDAAGTGTTTIGSLSTGNTIFPGVVKINSTLDIGDAVTDTLTITSVIDGDVTIDDGVTNSPALVLKDATDETLSITKLDAGYATFTTVAGDGVQVLTGNLKIGNGSPGTAAMDGEDFYCEGDSEFDGTETHDGAATFNGAVSCTSTLALSENVTFTMAADEYMLLDAATTDSTVTAGALDINFDSVTNGAEGINVKATLVSGGGGSEVVSGIVIDVDDDSDAAGTVIGLDVNSSDATGSSDIVGIRLGNALEDQISSTVGAANQFAVIDAATTDNTGTSGVIQLSYDTVTNGGDGVFIDMAVGDTGAGVTANGITVDLDDDTSSNAATINGVAITSSDLTGQANTVVRGYYTSGCDQAFQADNGYVRIGTGSTPGVTPGDDDLYVEGTVEVDGAIYSDGGITGDGQSDIVGMTSPVEAYTEADNVITIAESGKTFTNTGDADGSQHTLPEASTCIGCTFTFIVTAAQQMVIELDNADVFLHLTLDAGDQIQSSTVGDSITVRALDATNWGVVSVYPTAADWADGGA